MLRLTAVYCLFFAFADFTLSYASSSFCGSVYLVHLLDFCYPLGFSILSLSKLTVNNGSK